MRYFGLIRSFGQYSETVLIHGKKYQQLILQPPPWRAALVDESLNKILDRLGVAEIFTDNIETQIVAESSLDAATLQLYIQQTKGTPTT